MKRIYCLLMAVIITSFAVLPSSAFTIQDSGICMSADDTGAYEVSFSGAHFCVTRYASRNICAEHDLEHNIAAACAYRGRVLLLCDSSLNNQLIVYVYYIDSDYLDSFAVAGNKLYSNIDFGCDNDRFYIEDPNNSSRLNAYSYSGAYVKSYYFNNDITSVTGGYHSGVYVTAGNELYTLSGNDFTALYGASVKPPLFCADSDAIASAYGKVYVIDGGRISSSFDVDADQRAVSACVIGGCLYYPCGRTINGYDIYSGEKLCYYKTQFSAELLYADGSSVIAASGDSSLSIGTNAFVRLDTPSDNGGSQSDSKSPVSAVSKDADAHISSDTYDVDFDRMHITGITPGTTVSGFRSNMDYSGYTLEVYRNNSLRTSGNVGTAMTAVFSGDNGSFTFELSVVGDITGEGSRNSRDLNMLMDYLIGAADFNGVYMIAADVSGNDTVDAVDLAILKYMI